MMRNKFKFSLIIGAIFLMLPAIFAFPQPMAKNVVSLFERNYNTESDAVYNMVDEKGQTIHKTGLTIYVGDEFITQENKRYRVQKVKGKTAYSKFMGVEDMSLDLPKEKVTLSGNDLPVIQAAKGQTIALYHTHSDESYVPSDGTSSIGGKGGIFKVGNALADRLKTLGFKVDHSGRAHDPHDANAYSRSRRTAFDLLKKRPNALLDVHRDATPPEVYRRTVSGKDVTGVKLVVGRQNPKMNANFAFAKRLKAVADKTHPGLVTGIFMAKGDYNQDLGNRSMLIEVGSHTNTRDEAERGAALFADIMPEALRGTGTMAQAGGIANYTPTGSEAPGVMRAVLWVLGLAIGGGAIFLWIATGSIKNSIAKLRQFKNVEFTNYLGPKIKKKTKNDPDNENDQEQK